MVARSVSRTITDAAAVVAQIRRLLCAVSPRHYRRFIVRLRASATKEIRYRVIIITYNNARAPTTPPPCDIYRYVYIVTQADLRHVYNK